MGGGKGGGSKGLRGVLPTDPTLLPTRPSCYAHPFTSENETNTFSGSVSPTLIPRPNRAYRASWASFRSAQTVTSRSTARQGRLGTRLNLTCFAVHSLVTWSTVTVVLIVTVIWNTQSVVFTQRAAARRLKTKYVQRNLTLVFFFPYFFIFSWFQQFLYR